MCLGAGEISGDTDPSRCETSAGWHLQVQCGLLLVLQREVRCLLCPWDIVSNSVIGPYKLLCHERCSDSFSSWDQSWCFTRGWNKLLSKRVMITSHFIALAAVTNWVALALFHKFQFLVSGGYSNDGQVGQNISRILSQLFLWICRCMYVLLCFSPSFSTWSAFLQENLEFEEENIGCSLWEMQNAGTIGCGRRICFWWDLFFWTDLWCLYWNNGMH